MTKNELKAKAAAANLAVEHLKAAVEAANLSGEAQLLAYAVTCDLRAEASAWEAEFHRRDGNQYMAAVLVRAAAIWRCHAEDDRERAAYYRNRRAA